MSWKEIIVVGGLAAALLLGPRGFWNRQLVTEMKKCRCYCGQVFAMRIDLPKPNPPGEAWHPSNWFGAHETICFVRPTPDARARLEDLQAEAHRRRIEREGRD